MLSRDFKGAKNYGDLFTLVKKAVKRSLGEHRVGLMLYLGNLPLKVGAFHPLGTNDIVINRRLLSGPTSGIKNKAHVFSILLHEYLHSLGYTDEHQVRGLTYRVCVENFEREHPVVEAAISGPWADISLEDIEDMGDGIDLERVPDFERIDSGYII